jgi:hypothetical protein
VEAGERRKPLATLTSNADTGNRGPFAKEWCGIIEQPQMGELPIG